MKGLLTFPVGGVHPPEGKSLSSAKSVKKFIYENGEYSVPLSQHLGSPSEAVVEVGAVVQVGDLIGKSTGFISANIHSPVNGTVKEIRDIQLATGQRTSAIVIQEDAGSENTYKPSSDWESMDNEALITRIQESGIVGMGGAAFPSNVKISVPKGYTAEYLVINGVECEPYLTADHRLMLEEPDRILQGIAVLKKVLSVKNVYIGIENNKPDAIESLKTIIEKNNLNISVVPLKVKYPQGDEKQLLKAILGKEVPSGKLPIELGAVVLNVSTTAAVYDAVVCNKPLYERNVTVTGGAVKEPQNFRVKVGTPISALIEACGGFKGTPAKIVVGGPMMGFALQNIDTPVTKGTSGILVLSANEARTGEAINCITCGKCVAACPMGLNPSYLFKLVDHQEFEAASNSGLLDCKECGCCTYSCPSHIPLVNGFKAGKFELRRMQSRKK